MALDLGIRLGSVTREYSHAEVWNCRWWVVLPRGVRSHLLAPVFLGLYQYISIQMLVNRDGKTMMMDMFFLRGGRVSANRLG